MLLHARTNIGITFPTYFSKHNETAENILHVAKHSLKKKRVAMVWSWSSWITSKYVGVKRFNFFLKKD